jgi:aminoglycoside/choline kinase family phosphotransferase
MPTDLKEISELFSKCFGLLPDSIYRLPQSGSDRIYYRVTSPKISVIATENENVKENETFFYFSDHFKKAGYPVPEIFGINEEKTLYLQSDFGDTSLLDVLETKGKTDEVYLLFKQALSNLAGLQINGDKGLDYEQCITSKEFGKQAIISDLLYFKYYFLDTLKIPYDKEKLLEDFDSLGNSLAPTDYKFFMYRDFQSRNIMVHQDKVYFIDFQGGMKGALQYDVASFLWQAKAELPEQWKESLLNYYIEEVDKLLETSLDKKIFISQYNSYVLIRLLQVLGAYGFRGIFERKAHFLVSIPLALNNLKSFLEQKHTNFALPEFERLLNLVVSDEIINRFTNIKSDKDTPLVITINSFSYKKTGYPKDETANGGGFVFDCRGILNPGRIEEYKTQTGKDKPVKDYLEQHTEMPNFMNNVYNMVDISVTDYLKRGFTSLVVSFGCTGGQHRSVYAADALGRHLRNKFNAKINIHHIEQNWHEKKGFED